ncbi:transcription initiation factor IIB 2 [Sulfolobus sp. A20]|uniref:transcription initiation factor IIB n=3 Tax=Sulfolobaceae TaxID=118883 RepID=UPI000845E753|nr:transcription initiation factor IIB family protein [Sulfolobus sp. A20]TRM74368.1 transcription initiation factor IIB family protein [Sulfolobus sp. E5]TRM78171.1 transcription initiation factor IIB family protein [Sulfolobus sp. A20-N-F8]TRM79380.1 transcription initiation factor IIB family protein [Sulfolobus sp. B5]TRM84140.1 transcription initiation factor IIB family protein [Sulfolobus sp. A20-N-F6]TRM88834.1 transcription initiation factor IIB family protein [Sulfolobus sp. C3]TRM984
MKCPNCGLENVITQDHKEGILVCTNCGYVIEENIIDLGPDWRAYNSKDRNERERVGSPSTPKVHDWGFHTIIGFGRAKDRIKTIKMQRIQNKIRVSQKDKKLVTLLSILNDESAKLELPEHVKETASLILRKMVENGLTKRIDQYVLVIASLYYSCQVNNIPRHLQEFKSRYSISSSELWKALERVQSAAKSIPEFRPKLRPTEYIPKIIDRLRLPPIIGTKASELVDYMYKQGLTSGKGYLSLSAASVYLISALMDIKKTQKEVAEALDITEVTIRNRYKEIIDSFDITVML